MCRCLLESLRYSNSLGEICELYIVGFSVELSRPRKCGDEARSRIQGRI
jgi:hypothetical protein